MKVFGIVSNVDYFLNLSVNFLHFQDHKLNICTFLERFSIWTPGFVLVRLVVGHPSNKTVQWQIDIFYEEILARPQQPQRGHTGNRSDLVDCRG